MTAVLDVMAYVVILGHVNDFDRPLFLLGRLSKLGKIDERTSRRRRTLFSE